MAVEGTLRAIRHPLVGWARGFEGFCKHSEGGLKDGASHRPLLCQSWRRQQGKDTEYDIFEARTPDDVSLDR